MKIETVFLNDTNYNEFLKVLYADEYNNMDTTIINDKELLMSKLNIDVYFIDIEETGFRIHFKSEEDKLHFVLKFGSDGD